MLISRGIFKELGSYESPEYPDKMRYSSPICYKKWLGDSQKCGAHLHVVGTLQYYALKIAICLKKNPKNSNQQIAKTSLFQMRYDRLFNSMKWPSDKPIGSATPCFLQTLSVVLLCLLSNHLFSNLSFSGLGQSIFCNFI